jgi:conjugal transfer/entry exclusion protein
MVNLTLTKEQAQLLANIIDNAPFNGVVGQLDQVLSALQQVIEIKQMLAAKPEGNE